MPKLSMKERRNARAQARQAGHTSGRLRHRRFTGEPPPGHNRPRLQCSMEAGELVKAKRSLYNYRGDYNLPNIPAGSLGIMTDEKSCHSDLVVVMFGNQLADVKFKSLRPV